MLTAAHLAATWFMVGLIWTIQSVHYPLFAAVDSRSFLEYERLHTRRMGRLLALPAPVEIATALLLVVLRPDDIEIWAAWVAGALLAAAWLVTLAVQVPLHRRLSAMPESETIRRLVATNWVRTGLWTARGVLAAFFLI